MQSNLILMNRKDSSIVENQGFGIINTLKLMEKSIMENSQDYYGKRVTPVRTQHIKSVPILRDFLCEKIVLIDYIA